MPVQKAVLVPGLLFALLSLPQELGDQDRQNPGPGDPYPEDFVYDISGGGQFRLADFKGRKAVLIANHIVDDGSVSWHADPFKRLKELQAKRQVDRDHRHWDDEADEFDEAQELGALPDQHHSTKEQSRSSQAFQSIVIMGQPGEGLTPPIGHENKIQTGSDSQPGQSAEAVVRSLPVAESGHQHECGK